MKRHIQVAILGLIVLVVGVIAACGGGGSKEIRPSDYASTGWMLTVESAELHCKQFRFAEIGEKSVMWVEHDGKHYAVSSLARSYLKIQGIPRNEIYDIDEIWRGPEVNNWDDPLVDDAFELCGVTFD